MRCPAWLLDAGSRTSLLLNLASIVEKADEAVLPAVFLYIGRDLGASLSQLGTLTLARALAQAAASPLSGLLGDRADRAHVVAAGCLMWGVMTSAIGFSRSLGQAMVSCAGALRCPAAALRAPRRTRTAQPDPAAPLSHLH